MKASAGLTLPDPSMSSSEAFPFKKGLGEHGNPIPWSLDLARSIIHLFDMYSHDLINAEIPLSYPIEIRSEIFRFFCALQSYKESCMPLLPINFLVDGLLEGPAFITYLKQIRTVALVEGKGGYFDAHDESLDRARTITKGLKLDDIGQIFNYRYYFFWDQPDELDWKWCFEPLEALDPDDITRLEETTFSILPDEIPIIEEEEILLSVTGSGARDRDGKPSRVFVEKATENHFTNEPLEGWGTYIQKCPGDTRFSITLSVPHSNTVKLIEKQCALIAAEVPFSCYTSDDDLYFERYEAFRENTSSYFNRDLKKDGLTKVRPLIQAVCRAIQRKYPHMPACTYFSIFSDFFIWIDGEKHNPPRGVGLGMTSALTTILQSALFLITRQDMMDKDDSWGHMAALIYHDDITIGSSDFETLDTYSSVEDQVMTRYRQIKNKKKSHFDKWFVLCENYSDEFLDIKDSYQRYLLRQAYTACNVSHAKTIFSSNLRFISTVDWKPYLMDLINFWGFEYHSEEASSPFTLGGWVPAYYMEVDISLYLKPPSKKEMSAALAYTMAKPNAFKALKKYHKDPYYPPVQQIFGPNITLGSESETYLVGLTFREVARKFMDMKAIGSKSGYWSYVLTKRQEAFEQYQNQPGIYIQDFYKLYLQKHPKVDVIPPRELFVLEEIDHYPEVEELYTPSNPYLQFLAYLNPGVTKKSIMPWPVPPTIAHNKKLQLTAEERRQVQYSTTLLQKYNLGELVLMKTTPRLIISDQWFHPNQVRACVQALTGYDKLPRGEPRELLAFTKDINKDLLLILSDKRRFLTNYLTLRVNIENVVLIGQHLSTFASAVQPFIDARLAAVEMLKAHIQVVKDQEGLESLNTSILKNESAVLSNTGLSDSFFFLWLNTHKQFKDWRNGYFLSLAAKLERKKILNLLDLGQTGLDYKGEKWDEGCVLDTVEAYLYKRSGGSICEHNTPILNIKAYDLPSWSEHSDDRVSNPGSDPGWDEDINIW